MNRVLMGILSHKLSRGINIFADLIFMGRRVLMVQNISIVNYLMYRLGYFC